LTTLRWVIFLLPVRPGPPPRNRLLASVRREQAVPWRGPGSWSTSAGRRDRVVSCCRLRPPVPMTP